MKIFPRKAYEFRHPKTGETVQVRPLSIEQVPDWVADTELYALALANGNIEVMLSKEQEIRAMNGDEDPEVAELRALAKELGVPRWSQLGKEKLIAGIAKKQEEATGGGNGDPPDGGDGDPEDGEGDDNGEGTGDIDLTGGTSSAG